MVGRANTQKLIKFVHLCNKQHDLFIKIHFKYIFNINPLLSEFFSFFFGQTLFVYRLIVATLIVNFFDYPFLN